MHCPANIVYGQATNIHLVSIPDKKPKVGMRVDARDVDSIWSEATVVKVRKGTKSVTVRFDGWNENYNENIEWSNDRLAPLHSFTKVLKCLVDVVPKKRGTPKATELEGLSDGAPPVYCNLWPCKVQFRMPHPGNDEDCKNARAFLRAEGNIYVQPYETQFLPFSSRHSLDENGGKWLKAKRVQPWKANPTELGVLPENFDKCFRIAKNDTNTVGVLLPDAVEVGSLLKDEYCVHSRDGAKVRDGALHEECVTEEVKEEEPLESIAVAVDSVQPPAPQKYHGEEQKPSDNKKEEEEKKSSHTSCVIS